MHKGNVDTACHSPERHRLAQPTRLCAWLIVASPQCGLSLVCQHAFLSPAQAVAEHGVIRCMHRPAVMFLFQELVLLLCQYMWVGQQHVICLSAEQGWQSCAGMHA